MKKIVIISYFFAPANMIGAVRMTKLAKYLNKKGYDVQVFTSPNNSILFEKENNGYDEILANDIADISVTRVEHSNFYKKFASFLRTRFFNGKTNITSTSSSSEKSSIGSIKTKIRKKILHYGFYWVLMLQDIDFSIQGKRLINKSGGISDSVIISTYGPLANHLLAKKIRKRNKWIADFRDPIAQYENYRLERWINKRIENNIVKQADAVVGVADSYLKTILSDSDKEKNIITNGYDTEDLRYVPTSTDDKKKKLRFCYTGTLYSGMRDITPIFEAIQVLGKEGKINLNDIEIVYAGPQGEYVLNLANQYGVEEIIVNKGFVPRYESLAIQKDADVIIVLTWNVADNIGYLPGKFLEHLMFRKEIFGYIAGPYHGSELKQIVHDLNIGECFEETDADVKKKIQDYIEDLYNSKFHTYCKDKVDSYSYSNICAQYINLINRI